MTAPRIAKGGTRGTVYRAVAWLRIEDAESLLHERRWNGAVYLAGYAVECQLKYAYCQRKACGNLPAFLEVHDWERIIDKAGLLKDIKAQSTVEAIYSAIVDQWGPSLRYRTSNYSETEANRLYNQIKELCLFFRDLVP
jgi:hypothetical protein